MLGVNSGSFTETLVDLIVNKSAKPRDWINEGKKFHMSKGCRLEKLPEILVPALDQYFLPNLVHYFDLPCNRCNRAVALYSEGLSVKLIVCHDETVVE